MKLLYFELDRLLMPSEGVIENGITFNLELFVMWFNEQNPDTVGGVNVE